MRVIAAVVSLTSLAGCGPSNPPYVEIGWQLQCSDQVYGCPHEGEAHRISAFNGEQGMAASCTVHEVDAGQVVNIRVNDNGDGIWLRNVTVSPEGQVVQCALEVVDDETRYVAESTGCSRGPPSEHRPCQVSEVEIHGSSVSGAIRCLGLTAPVAPDHFVRDLGSPDAPREPVRFDLEQCARDGAPSLSGAR